MTQEEIDLIYEYLHENYDYVDGNLVRIKKCKGQKIGKILGCYTIKDNNRIINIPLIRLNKKRYRIQIQFLIYIFFNKTKPRYITFIDKNPVNTRIENLLATEGLIKLSSKIRSDNKTGIAGISIARKKFQVNVYFNKKIYYCGNYINMDAAVKIKKEVENILSLNPGITQIELHNLIGYKAPSRKRGRTKKFISKITVNKKIIYLGSFDTPEEAHQAYLKAKQEYSK